MVLRQRHARLPRHDCDGHRRLVATALVFAYAHGWRDWRWSAVALVTVIPASELTIQILQRLISRLIPPRRLPRLELRARARSPTGRW